MLKPIQSTISSMMLICSVTIAQAGTDDRLHQYIQSWTGQFGEQKIGIFIQQISATHIQGYSIIGHHQRPFQGRVYAEDGIYRVTADEPMTNSSDGKFTFVLDPKFPSRITGEWMSQDPKIEAKQFGLIKRSCEAGRQTGDYAGSQRTLAGDELQTSPWELSIMRNEIYARHGYSFANKEMAAYFSEKDWYIPCYINVEKKLTTLEKQNIKRLEKAEKYAKTVDWGR